MPSKTNPLVVIAQLVFPFLLLLRSSGGGSEGSEVSETDQEWIMGQIESTALAYGYNFVRSTSDGKIKDGMVSLDDFDKMDGQNMKGCMFAVTSPLHIMIGGFDKDGKKILIDNGGLKFSPTRWNQKKLEQQGIEYINAHNGNLCGPSAIDNMHQLSNLVQQSRQKPIAQKLSQYRNRGAQMQSSQEKQTSQLQCPDTKKIQDMRQDIHPKMGSVASGRNQAQVLDKLQRQSDSMKQMHNILTQCHIGDIEQQGGQSISVAGEQTVRHDQMGHN